MVAYKREPYPWAHVGPWHILERNHMSKAPFNPAKIDAPRPVDRHSIDPIEQKKKMKHLRDKDRELVKGIFRFYEVPGGTMAFVIKLYKEDQTERYELIDGEIYTIPLGVAKHLNKNGWYPIYKHVKGEENIQQGYGMGAGGMTIGKKVRRFGFQSLEFVDTDDLTPEGESILQVSFK